MADNVRVEMKDIRAITKGLGFGRMGKVQKFVDSQLAKGLDKYVPKDSGTLKDSVNQSIFGSGRLVYNTNYAAYQYHHGRNNGLRGAKWDRRFMDMEGHRFVDMVQRYVRKIK